MLSSRTRKTIAEQRAKEREDFRQMLRPEVQTAFDEVLEMMGANAGAANHTEPAFTPIRSFVAGPFDRLMKVGPVSSDGGSDPVTQSPNPSEHRLPR